MALSWREDVGAGVTTQLRKQYEQLLLAFERQLQKGVAPTTLKATPGEHKGQVGAQAALRRPAALDRQAALRVRALLCRVRERESAGCKLTRRLPAWGASAGVFNGKHFSGAPGLGCCTSLGGVLWTPKPWGPAAHANASGGC